MLVGDRDRAGQVGQRALQLPGVLRAVELTAGGRGDLPERGLVGDQRVAAAAAERAAAERPAAAAERTAPGASPICELSQTIGAGVVVPKPIV